VQEQEAFAALVKRVPGYLDRPIEELVKMRAIGDVYLAAHKRMMKEIKAGKLKLAEEDLKTRQAEADTVGSAVLDSKVKIGEMSKAEPQARGPGAGHGRGGLPSGKPQKHKRLGLGEKEMGRYQVLARNPKAIEQVKAEAREFGDPPTETAVLQRIRLDHLEKNIGKREKSEKDISEVALILIRELGDVVAKLPALWREKQYLPEPLKESIVDAIKKLFEIVEAES